MAFKRYKAIADSTIVNYGEYTTEDSRFANLGGADSLEVYSIHERIYSQSAENSRVLVNFDFEQIRQDREKYVTPSTGSVKYYIRMYNVEHPETLPKQFELSVLPISYDWNEGTGLDLETYTDYGFTNTGSYGFGVNWIYRMNQTEWNNQGSDYHTGSNNEYNIKQFFDDGTEDLELDITNTIEDYFSGLIDLHGFTIKLSEDYENAFGDVDIVENTYYTKRFSARTSEYFFKRPVIEARWEPVIKDNYPNLYINNDFLEENDNKMSLYYYHVFGGKAMKLPDSVYNDMEIIVYSGSNVFNFKNGYTLNKINDSTYRFDFILDNDENFESLINQEVDSINASYRVFSGSSIIYEEIDTLTIKNKTPNQDNFQDDSYTFSISNLKPKYFNKEVANLYVHSRPINWNPNVYTKFSNSIETVKHNNLYYKITRVKDGFTVLEYSDTDFKYSKLGYDRKSNILDIDMSVFEPGYMYEIKLALLSDTHFDECKETFKFRVME